MEPLDERELNRLLRKWEAPSAPPTLKARVFPVEQLRWRWLMTGTIRVPVPIALAAAVLIALWIHSSMSSTPRQTTQPGRVSLADFEPVRQLEPVLVRGGQK